MHRRHRLLRPPLAALPPPSPGAARAASGPRIRPPASGPPPHAGGRRRPRRLFSLLLAALLLPYPGPGTALADTGPWTWPLAGEPPVVRGFAPPPRPWLAGHRGVDLAAAPGAQVRAAGAGRVAFAGTVAGTPLVTVVHGTLRTTYLPVDAAVRRGDRVAAGDAIGTLADAPAHCARRPCLHWGLLRGRDYLDPLSLLGLTEVRLLPAGARPR
ncbi:murein hydrolase activator EnvC family protein [Marinitenerispora sediminis]|uniref:M23ase beta-sheet core domain-containing protein n=1 Tax=Marinitenerispora sediminis TaxID=1931232 RepID=A0A368T6G6_9ACTN|nr:M23 family metallopeptidase [Marinitenerispora sediminis]RCV48640.1 hypothetical protein DEF28_22930 [Marinitenerispora sediminis]RCV50599.1 hypothetical protein DEF23_21815 [Marinitenerispora sediminis]RCV56109.1 hypothetical protein DEF24_17110 [Marinitenerispora sediminis]